VRSLGLPIPLPQKLARDPDGPWLERPLDDQTVIVGGGPNPGLSDALAETLTEAGAQCWIADDTVRAAFEGPGEAWGRPPRGADGLADDLRANALVFDGTGVRNAADLRSVYDFFHARMRGLRSNGRVVVLGRPHDQHDSVPAAAAARALEGFARALAKEVGSKGGTAQIVTVETGAEDRLAPVLRFVLSKRSAYISGQPLRVSDDVIAPVGGWRWTRPLDGKVALVTGAARGIGAATAETLAREGAHVIVLDRPDDSGPASRVAERIGGTLIGCDVTADDAGDRLCELISEKFGGIDIIVHNAGVTRDKTLKNMDEARWDLTLGVNLQAVIQLTEALDDLLRPDARIICLSSVAGIAGNFGQTNYAASKAGIIGYTEALAADLAPRGIAVNAIAPGFIETRLTAAIPAATREVARRLCNLSQGGQPIDIAEAVTFLSSPGAAAMSGRMIRVCGGALIGA
jgi:3-oxoacyl-[acyl-carrier protein] reductase